MAHDHSEATSSAAGRPDHKKFGLVKVTLSYHWNNRQWEVDLDPTEIDLMIFGWANYEKYKPWLPGSAGGPTQQNLTHLMPDGLVHGKKDKWPVKVLRGPVDVGEPHGDSVDDFCWHSPACLWWCVSDTHLVPSQ
jgi:hypothetical protein